MNPTASLDAAIEQPATCSLLPVVLLVDDEPGVLSSLRRVLRAHPYRVIAADSGAAALEILETTTVDLVISDMRMPHMSGADLLARVRALYPETMRILLTGYAEIDAVVRAINEAAVFRYLNKPWDEHDLLSSIGQALEHKRLASETARLTAITRAQNDELRELNSMLEASLGQRTADVKRLERHDRLTGLYNRDSLTGRIESTLGSVQSGRCAAAVLVVSLNRFKAVNELCGHQFGDLVLLEVARRLSVAVRSGDAVARLSGDEFAIVATLDRRAYADAAARLAARLLEEIREPVKVRDKYVSLDAAIGVALMPSDCEDACELLRAADVAMSEAKRESPGGFRFFENRMHEMLRETAALESGLRSAIETAAIVPHYQPLIDIQADRIFGFEILARWHDPERGWISPERFIPVAEHLGLIQRLSENLLRRACRDAAGWSGEAVSLALNISPAQLGDRELPERLLTVLREEGFPAARLEIEITETALVGDFDAARTVLQALRLAGMRIALDDFGTGYSSLYYLRELRFDKLKIDRSFVQSMRTNRDSERIVDAVLALARSLGMQAVAEGIEDELCLDRLRVKGCMFGQGFHLGRPMGAKDAGALLATGWQRGAHGR